MKKYIAALFLAIVSISFGSIMVRTEFQNTPSKIYITKKGNIEGITVDIIKLIEKKSNYKFVYKNTDATLVRIEDDLIKNKIDVYFGMLKNGKREKNIEFIEPLYDINYILVTRADNNEDIKNMKELKIISEKKPVLTLFGSIIEDYLDELKIKNEAGAKSVESNFEKILKKRADYFIYHDLAVKYEMNNKNYKDKLKILNLVIKKDTLWFVVSKKCDEKIKKDIKNSIANLKKTTEWKEIMNKYRVNAEK